MASALRIVEGNMFYVIYLPTSDLLADDMHINLLCNIIELLYVELSWMTMFWHKGDRSDNRNND